LPQALTFPTFLLFNTVIRFCIFLESLQQSSLTSRVQPVSYHLLPIIISPFQISTPTGQALQYKPPTEFKQNKNTISSFKPVAMGLEDMVEKVVDAVDGQE